MKITIKNNPVTIRIEGGGGEPPTPAPVAVYDNWIGFADPCLVGFATDEFEEVEDGN